MKKRLFIFLMATFLTVSVKAETTYNRGDVDHSGKVDITDAVMLVNYILGEIQSDFFVAQADVNKDGRVDISDIVKLIDIILNGDDDDSQGPPSIITPPDVENSKGITYEGE